MCASTQITGGNLLCTSATYSAPIGGTFNNWTITQGASLVTLTGNGTPNVTLTALPDVSGAVTLSLTMGDNFAKCGNVTITKTIWVGKPILEDFSNSSFCQGGGQREQNSIQIGSGSPLNNYQWIICEDPTISPCLNSTGVSIIGNSNQSKIYFNVPNTASGIPIFVRASNSCGWSEWLDVSRYAENCNATDPGCIQCFRTTPNKYIIYPNPSNDIVNIDLRDENNLPEKGAVITGELFDIIGASKSKVEINNNKATFSVRGLNKGIYVLKIYINNQVESHQIAVE